MAKLGTHAVRDLARKIVAESPGGVRYSELVERIASANPETPKNTIHGSVWDLPSRFPTEIVKPSRGLLMPAGASGSITNENEPGPPVPRRVTIREEEFYDAFADWIKVDLDEVTTVRVWAAPDSRQSGERQMWLASTNH